MAGTNIAQLYATLGIRVPTNEIQKVDKLISQIQQRFKRLGQNQKGGLDLTNIISFDQRKLRSVMQRAFDQVSRTTYFEIKNFRIDTAHLTSQLRAAMERASATTKLRPHVGEARGSGGHGRLGVSAGLGAAGGLTLGRLYGPALAVAAGGYGLGALNRKNQEIQSAQLTTQAVVMQAGGSEQQGNQAFQWLQQQGNKTGFNWLSAANDYNRLLSGVSGAGMSIAQGQNIFKGFAEYGRVNHIDNERQKRVFLALSQVAGKGKLQGDELTNQLAESLPGAVSIFAEAYQTQTKGGLQGQAAIEALLADMKKGKVTSSILNPAAQIASQRAAPSLAHSARTSQSEQARFQNEMNRLTMVANQSGVEEGYARLFRTLNDGLSESGGLVKTLSSAFNDASKFARELLLVPQSFQRMLQGRDSFITELVGNDRADEIRTLFKDMETFGNNFSALTTTIGNGWKLIFQQMQQIDGLDITKLAMKQLGIANNTIGAVNSLASGDTAGAAQQGGDAFAEYIRRLTTPARALLDPVVGTVTGSDNPVTDTLNRLLGGGQKEPTYDPVDSMGRMNGTIQRGNSTTTVNVGDITIQTQATDAQGIASDLQQQVRQALMIDYSDTRLNYPSVGR